MGAQHSKLPLPAQLMALGALRPISAPPMSRQVASRVQMETAYSPTQLAKCKEPKFAGSSSAQTSRKPLPPIVVQHWQIASRMERPASQKAYALLTPRSLRATQEEPMELAFSHLLPMMPKKEPAHS